VTQILLEQGPSTAASLSARLGLTPAAVRRHLDALLADGSLVARDARVGRSPRGRGRPAKVFALSDAGHAAMGTGYDAIATAALSYLRETGGADAVASFARARVADLESRYGQRIAEDPSLPRPQALAEVLSADGYAATTEPLPAGGVGVQICQHHCPVQHVAEQFPEFCDAETEAFGRLLGTHVQRLATIAHGDGVCTTHVPLPKSPRTSPGTNPSERADI
jgi:predicted ArsR family transcriptional regulator